MQPYISKRKILWLTLLLGIAFSGAALAKPVLKDTDVPADIYENQETQLKLAFEWPAAEGDYEMKGPETIKVTNLKFLGLSQSQQSSSSISRIIQGYRLLPLKKGQGSIAGFDVLYRRPNQAGWNQLSVPSFIMGIKPALPWKKIIILLSILAAIILPFLIWLVAVSWADRKREKSLESDPKQLLYAEAAKIISEFITGYTESSLQTVLSRWSGELTRVVMTYYDIPVRPATKNEILKELRTKNISAGEIQVIEDLFRKVEHLRFSTDVLATSRELEDVRRSLLQYVKGKTIIGNL